MPAQKTCGIYKITSPIGHVYIGASINIEQRVRVHKSTLGKNHPKLFMSLMQYGWEKHVFEIIHKCLHEELEKLERYYIKMFDCFDTPHGLNLQSGGSKNKKISKESVEKSRAGNIGQHAGEKNSMYGKSHTKKAKQKISKANKGRKHTVEHRLKNSQGLKGRVPWNKGIKLGDEHRDYKEKLSRAHKGRKRSKESIDKFKQTIKNRTLEEKGKIGNEISKRLIGHCVSKETRNKISNSRKSKYADKKLRRIKISK